MSGLLRACSFGFRPLAIRRYIGKFSVYSKESQTPELSILGHTCVPAPRSQPAEPPSEEKGGLHCSARAQV